MSFNVVYGPNLGQLGRVIADAAALNDTQTVNEQNQRIAQQQQQMQLAARQANRQDAMFDWEKQNAWDQRQNQSDLITQQQQQMLERWKQEQQYSLGIRQKILDMNNANAEKQASLVMDAQTKALVDQFDRASTAVMADESIGMDQKYDMLQQIESARKNAVFGALVGTKKPSPQDKFNAEVFTGPGGLPTYYDNKGELKQLLPPKDSIASAHDAEMAKAYVKFAGQQIGTNKDGSPIYPNDVQIQQRMAQMSQWFSVGHGTAFNVPAPLGRPSAPTGQGLYDQQQAALYPQGSMQGPGNVPMPPPPPQDSGPVNPVGSINMQRQAAEAEAAARQREANLSRRPSIGQVGIPPETMLPSAVPNVPFIPDGVIRELAQKKNIPYGMAASILTGSPMPGAPQAAPVPVNPIQAAAAQEAPAGRSPNVPPNAAPQSFGKLRENERYMAQTRGYTDPSGGPYIQLKPVGHMYQEWEQRNREAMAKAVHEQLSSQPDFTKRPYKDVPWIDIPPGEEFWTEMKRRGYSDKDIVEFDYRRNFPANK